MSKPRIALFQCRWCLYSIPDQEWVDNELPENIKMVKVPCTGRVNSLYLLNAIQGGVDGIMVSGCLPEKCHFKEGNLGARRQLDEYTDFMDYIGFDKRRLRMFWIDLQDRGHIQRELAEFEANLSQLEAEPAAAFATRVGGEA